MNIFGRFMRVILASIALAGPARCCDKVVDEEIFNKEHGQLTHSGPPLPDKPSCGLSECTGTVDVEGMVDEVGNIHDVKIVSNTMTNRRETFAGVAKENFVAQKFSAPLLDGVAVCTKTTLEFTWVSAD